MKALSRDFTTKERVMLLVLGLLLVALAYYQFIAVPCAAAIENAAQRRDALQLQLVAAQAKEEKLKKMQTELEGLGKLSERSRMGSYNNSKAELSLLNGVLESANEYVVSFSSVTRDGDQIRRNFRLQFTADDFDEVEAIIGKLLKSEYRCLLGSMSYSTQPTRVLSRTSEDGRTVGAATYVNTISVNATATFFETMYDGTPDAGLPPDPGAE